MVGKWIALSLLVGTLSFSIAGHCLAENPASWIISEGTSGEDVFWTSPTAVDLGFPRYATSFEITRVEAFAGILSLDVTDQLAETSGTTTSGSLPVTLIQGTFSDPGSGTSATVDIGIDPNGFGQAAITDVTLGQVVIIFPINITRIEVDANVDVEGLIPGDFDRSLTVDFADLGIWEAAYGFDVTADTDFNGQSDGLDFLEWQIFHGTDLTPQLLGGVVVPEPQSMGIIVTALITLPMMSQVRRVRRRP